MAVARYNNHTNQEGFTLTELLVVVVLLGILSGIGVPMYTGYTDTAKITNVKNNLRAIALQQQEYLTDMHVYYTTGITCTDSSANINTTLFKGKQAIKNEGWRYCILQTTTADFTARAEEVTGGRVFTLNQNNVANF